MRDWQLGYDDGLAGHRQQQSNALDVLAYRKGWVEGNAAILQVTVAIQTGMQPPNDRRSSSRDRRVGDRRAAARQPGGSLEQGSGA